MARAAPTAFGRRIAAEIAARNWTLHEAASRCGVPLATLAAYKDGRILGRGPQARRTVARIARGLGIPGVEAAAMVGGDRTDEDQLLILLRRLSPVDRATAVRMLRTFANARRRQKEDQS